MTSQILVPLPKSPALLRQALFGSCHGSGLTKVATAEHNWNFLAIARPLHPEYLELFEHTRAFGDI